MAAGDTYYSDYDDFAWFYNRYWGAVTAHPPMLDALDDLLLSRLARGARVLDICCGTGQLAAVLSERGFAVTGIDGSARQLEYARRNAPACEFVHADARDFDLPETCDAALSVYDSLNHIMTVDDLRLCFRNACNACKPGGVFLFDLNTEEGLVKRWKGSNAHVEGDNAFIMLFSYDAEEKVARADTTMFRLEEGVWHRSDVALFQTAYPDEAVADAVRESGFSDVSVYDGLEVLGTPMGEGRAFFLARK
ncbi:MAG: class I SAM-dependent methyltransferase [Actinobacteria bacterium]|nr:class I SAM-dependent methyltransferase [Actinomycetota bacterium]